MPAHQWVTELVSLRKVSLTVNSLFLLRVSQACTYARNLPFLIIPLQFACRGSSGQMFEREMDRTYDARELVLRMKWRHMYRS